MTQRVGALDDRYLARSRPLGEARVLWEIGAAGSDVRALRARLDVDSGYLSRLLRSLEAAGLVAVRSSEADARVRTATLTARGRAERALLDARSDELAWSFLEPLPEEKRERLVAAMNEVERLLTSALVELQVLDPTDPRAGHCLRSYYAELDSRFATGFDPDQALPLQLDEMRPPAGLFVVALLHGEPVGCGGLKFHGRAPTELKRLWVSPSVRGLGVGRRLVADLEERASLMATSRIVQLDTNATLVEAIALYRSGGYEEVEPFNDEPYANHWFRKRLPPRSRR